METGPSNPHGLSPFYSELRHRWRAFGLRMGLPNTWSDLPDATRSSWGEVLDRSVHFPGLPVFRGATFVDQLPGSTAEALLREHGRQGIVDFYCFMLQVHEVAHEVQTGEPLLNEIVQAAVWCAFLDAEELWDFQAADGICLVRERVVVRRFPELAQRAMDAGLDTPSMVRRMATSDTYTSLCLEAHHFDTGQLRYAAYLSEATRLLEGTRRRNRQA